MSRMIVPANLMERAAPLIGVPWVVKGTTPLGWDCLGLAYWCLRNWCGVEVADYRSLYSVDCIAAPHRREERARLLADGLSQWQTVLPQAGTLARLRWMGRVGHVGFMLSDTLVLHADMRIGTALLDLDAPASQYSLAGAVLPSEITEIVTG